MKTPDLYLSLSVTERLPTGRTLSETFEFDRGAHPMSTAIVGEMMTTALEQTSGRMLIDSDLFDRLCRKIVLEKDADQAFAERIMDQALAFLGACAKYPGQSLAPSQIVDVGWHTFILYTKEYKAFCDNIAGRFIHHVPQDAPGAPEHAKAPVSVRDNTVDAIRRAGYIVDPDFWIDGAYNCGPCHEDGNCAASGKDGNENTESRTK